MNVSAAIYLLVCTFAEKQTIHVMYIMYTWRLAYNTSRKTFKENVVADR